MKKAKSTIVLLLIIISTFMINISEVLAANVKGVDGSGADSGTMTKSVNCPIFGSTTNPDDFAYYLQFAFNLIRFIGPVLVLVMTIIDLIKITADQKPDGELQKMGGKTLKRIIYAALLFILPGLITWLFEALGLFGTCVV